MAREPHSPEIQVFAGNWYVKNQRPEEAKTAYSAALTANPGYVPAKYAMARLCIAERQYDVARQRLTRILAADDQDVTAHLLLATMEESAGNADAAILHYRNVVELSPADVLSLNNLAYLLSNQSSDWTKRSLMPSGPRRSRPTILPPMIRSDGYSAAKAFIKAHCDT